MKKLFLPMLLAIAFTACKKDKIGMPAAQENKMTGKWNIITVTVIPRDSTGKAINGGTIYPEPSYYYFQFNANLTWVENLAPETTDIGESGNYVLHEDTGFTLVNSNALSMAAECHIVSLTDTSFIFSHQRSALFNGVTPGYLEYVFKLGK
jgi:hypothetical protein